MKLLVALFLICGWPLGLKGQGNNAASPTKEELLDFDSASGKAAPGTNVVAPAPVTPAPVTPPPAIQSGAGAPTAPPAVAAPPIAAEQAPAQGMAPVTAPPSLPDINSQNTTGAPPPPAAVQNTTDIAAPPPPPAAETAPPPPPAAEIAAPPPAMQSEVGPPPEAPPETSPEVKIESESPPPPPEVLDENPPVLSAPKAAPPPPPAAETASAPAPTTDSSEISPGDLKNEARFSRIYKKYNQTELGDEKWGEIAGTKSSENYSLQDGDNLWDVSTKFFGSGYYWPKVWQLNGNITNPHMVRTGNTLQFSPGSTTTAPSLSVTENVNNQENNDTNVQMSFEDMPDPAPEVEEIPTADAPTGNTILIPPPRKRRPVLTQIPPSFPDWRDAASSYDAHGFSMDVFKPITAHRKPSAVPSIIASEPWEASGEVVEMEGETTVASTYQNVFIRLDVPAKTGDIFTIFSNSGKVADPTSLLPSTVGYEVDTRAEVRIEEALAGTTDTYRGMIIFTALPVRLGDQVRSGRLINRVFFDHQGSPSSVAAKIVDGEYNHREVFALHNIVYLDKGSQDGLQVGSLLNVIKNDRLRNAKSIVKFDPKPIGLLKVVALDSHVATATIVSEYDAIVPGDETAVPSENELTNEDKKEQLDKMGPPAGGSGAVGEDDANAHISPEE